MSIDPQTLREMAAAMPAEDRDEMAIPSYLHKNPALRWMAWRRVKVVGRRVAALCPPGGRVMDFGCGTGVLFQATLAVAAEVIGVDTVLTAATLWRARAGLDRVRLLSPEAAEALPTGCLDLVIAAEVLEHIDVIEAPLALFARLLKPGGRLLVSLPTENAAYRFGRRLAGFSGHFHVHNAASIDGRIQAFGYTRERLEHIPAPGPLSIYWVAEYRPPLAAGR